VAKCPAARQKGQNAWQHRHGDPQIELLANAEVPQGLEALAVIVTGGRHDGYRSVRRWHLSLTAKRPAALEINYSVQE
jgi:hypothetical protein